MDIRRRAILSETLHGGGSSEGTINIDNYLTIEALEDGLTASLSTNACEYCVDGDGNWKSLSADTTTEAINTGQTLSFRGEIIPNISSGIGSFSVNKKFNLLGNCMSMLFRDNAADNFSLEGKGGAFRSLFKASKVIEVSDTFLPATTLAISCYRSMFDGCTSLTAAPELPATTLASSCYYNMFYGCTSLTDAPELPATTLASSCYYNMFFRCTSLTTAPELLATKLASSCYKFMFYNCSKLNHIKMLATDISASSCLDYWVISVASAGTFVKNPAMTTLPTGTSGIPEGWTVVNDGEESGGNDGPITFNCADALGNLHQFTIPYSMTWEEFVETEYNTENELGDKSFKNNGGMIQYGQVYYEDTPDGMDYWTEYLDVFKDKMGVANSLFSYEYISGEINYIT